VFDESTTSSVVHPSLVAENYEDEQGQYIAFVVIIIYYVNY